MTPKWAQNSPISRPYFEAIFTHTVVQTGPEQGLEMAWKWPKIGVYLSIPLNPGYPGPGPDIGPIP